MPSGGLMQLVSYGSEDLYLTGNPQVTFFKVAYQRHTNFAYEWIPQYFNPQNPFSTITPVKMSAPLNRDGDLIRDIALVIDLPAIYSSVAENFKWVRNLGQVFVSYADFIIGGQRINRQYGLWLNIWSELTVLGSQRPGYNELIANVPACYSPPIYYGDAATTSTPTIPKRRMRIPLSFWFTENPGLALPLISIQYTEVSVDIEVRRLNDLFTVADPPISPDELFNSPLATPGNQLTLSQQLLAGGWNNQNLFWKFVGGTTVPTGSWNQNIFIDVKFVYLDSPERRLFAASVNEYLIMQPEMNYFGGLMGGNNMPLLSFFHPVKEMIWVFQRDDVYLRNQWTNFTTLPNENDLSLFYDLLIAYRNADLMGITPTVPFTDVVLPSGMTVAQFIEFINCTDTNKLWQTDMSAFDQYLNIFYYGKFIFNQHDRQETKTHYYYAYQEPMNSHIATPPVTKQIYTMSFADRPELVQPSGSANFGRFQRAQFQFTLKDRQQNPVNGCAPTSEQYNLLFFVRQINILRVMNGLAGLVFAN